jgi:hypothetical protein
MTAAKRNQSRITVGWSARTGEWKADSPAGRVLGALRAGCFLTDAAVIGGIARSTAQNWLARGAEHRGDEEEPDRKAVDVAIRPYLDFARAVERANGQIKLRASVEWTRAGVDDWRAWERFLMLRFPDQYKKPTDRIEAKVELLASEEWIELRSFLLETSERFCPACHAIQVEAVQHAYPIHGVPDHAD